MTWDRKREGEAADGRLLAPVALVPRGSRAYGPLLLPRTNQSLIWGHEGLAERTQLGAQGCISRGIALEWVLQT